MTIKKTLVIGIIALFIGMSFSPVSSVATEEKETMIPVQIGSLFMDGTLGAQTILLSRAELATLQEFMESFKRPGQRPDVLINFLRSLIGRDRSSGLLDLGILSKLPGNPIVSFGEGRQYLTRYHGQFQFKKLITAWHYPNNAGATIIWGDGLLSPPTQVLLQRQIGIMIGFVGIYLYIPPISAENVNSRTLFVGSAMYARGLSI